MMDEKINSSSEDEVLELEEDIYCFTYLEFIKEDDPKIHRELMLKCVLAFMMQIILCYCVLGETINIFEAGETEQDEHTLNINCYFTGGAFLNGVRYACSYLLHMSIIKEIKTSLELLKYAINHPDNFNGPHGYHYVYLIMMMKILGGISTEIINMVKMGQAT